MSLTRNGPLALPLLAHSSAPCTPSFAEKKTRLSTCVSDAGFELAGRVLISSNKVGVKDGSSRSSSRSARNDDRPERLLLPCRCLPIFRKAEWNHVMNWFPPTILDQVLWDEPFSLKKRTLA